MTLADKEFTSKRNRVKRTRTVFEIIVIVVLLYVIINALFVFAKYKPFTLNNTEFGTDEGFVAISYFGVDRTGTNVLIGKEQLEHHLEVLKLHIIKYLSMYYFFQHLNIELQMVGMIIFQHQLFR